MADRDAGEQAVERAFETVFNAEIVAAERCEAIEGGANLVLLMEEVSSCCCRSSGPSGLARTGHAVGIGEEWKVSRDTWCALVGMLGVECPPPAAP